MPIFRFILALAGCLILSESMAQGSLLKTKFYCRATHGKTAAILRELSGYCGVAIEFSPSSLDTAKIHTLTAGRTSLGAVLDKMLAGQYVTVTERNNKIIVGKGSTPLPDGYLQEKYMLYGYIQQESGLEPLPFASVTILPDNRTIQSNVHGFYSLQLPAGRYVLMISFSGASSKTVTVDLQDNTSMNLVLSPVLLPEVQVDAGNLPRQDAAAKLDRYKGGMYSNMLGETDPVRSMYLLPGNTESQESGGKLLVRGGEPGQSMFLLDGNPVFNPAHLLGEVSILGNTSIKSVLQYKNDFPSRLSGGLSSITAINTKEGNMEHWTGEAEAGLSSLAFALEGPLKKERTAMMVSARSSLGESVYHDIFTYDANFGDIHLKLTHLLNKNNKLMVSSYIGNDRLELTQDNSQYLHRWNNTLTTVNWNSIIGRRVFVNTAFNYSSYNNYMAIMYTPPFEGGTGGLSERASLNNYSSGRRYEGKTEIELTTNDHLQHFFGGRLEHTTIRPYRTLLDRELKEYADDFVSRTSLPFSDLMVYYESAVKAGNRFLLRAGIHFNAYRHDGFHYQSFQPRLFSSFVIDQRQRINLAYTHIGQLLHMITSPYTGIDRELWLPANTRLRPAENRMVNIGYEYKDNRSLNITADVYYRKISNLAMFAEKTNILYSNDSTEKSIVTGTGWSYGAEAAVEKRFNKWKMLLSYTLSWSWRKSDSLNNGEKQAYRYDRRHNVNVLLGYRPLKGLEVSLLWHFHTGDFITLPALISFRPEETFADTNMGSTPFRGAVYNRMNLNASYRIPTRGRFKHSVGSGVHAIMQSHEQYVTTVATTAGNYTMPLYQEQLFRFNPYFTYKLSF
ncbi:TonB-dependent receptor [Chitinophaga filiformis]|uniref:TonB-dependent receptor n=1 Tax=Chitinophaga filiformis TaxID=104663 RepID=UPI001F461880|nr:TonB-dependent receptor [Chitinophaga filiformis]MCF6406705.1 TonB-dependent receptor [Chitinophaga filiformis]